MCSGRHPTQEVNSRRRDRPEVARPSPPGDVQEMIGFFAALAASAAPSDLAARWAKVEPAIRAHTAVPVPLSLDDVTTIQGGEVAASRFDTDQGAYATGAVWLDAPIEQVWLVLNDGPHEPPGRVTVRVLESPPTVRRVHMTLALPFPIADRQWVSDIVPNRALYDATGGVVWQRQWNLADPALATVEDGAVWLKENRGAWTLVDTGDGTLMLFTVRTVLGGLVPTSIANGWAIRSLRRTFQETGPRANQMPAHYTADHFVVRTPAGVEVARWPR